MTHVYVTHMPANSAIHAHTETHTCLAARTKEERNQKQIWRIIPLNCSALLAYILIYSIIPRVSLLHRGNKPHRQTCERSTNLGKQEERKTSESESKFRDPYTIMWHRERDYVLWFIWWSRTLEEWAPGETEVVEQKKRREQYGWNLPIIKGNRSEPFYLFSA